MPGQGVVVQRSVDRIPGEPPIITPPISRQIRKSVRVMVDNIVLHLCLSKLTVKKR